MIWVSVLFFVYFLILFLFSLVSHPVYYCGFLVVNSLICSFIGYLILGFSWYSLLFCLIYIGGVYILFVFVSVYSPNSNYVTYYNMNIFSLFFLVFVLLIMGSLVVYNVYIAEFSSFLCTINEGNFYVSMCLTLLFGFIVLSLIMSVKLNYYR
uniref:NADH dehydrogenase subunit 6 n=1 Tax=Hymenolepis diminuta TaxID=6216 RepID=Q958J1_HYMDI|nr:NADH dehydrogenase subunit 6 [Hymenolepis diminuta]AAK51331.1 NADH dehydrogenase subunit 6 [Hymenolepis diminuta]BAV82501.1 NADH dehydrogenase subunit 6 [Hymenolepis diminuta]